MIPYPTRDTDDFSLTDFRSRGSGGGQKQAKYVAETEISAPVRRELKPNAIAHARREPSWGTLEGGTAPVETNIYLRSLAHESDEPNLAAERKCSKGDTFAINDDSTLLDTGDKIVARQKADVRTECVQQRRSTDVIHANRFLPQKRQLQVISKRSAPLTLKAPMIHQGDTLKKILLTFALLITVLTFESMSSKLINIIKASTGLS